MRFIGILAYLKRNLIYTYQPKGLESTPGKIITIYYKQDIAYISNHNVDKDLNQNYLKNYCPGVFSVECWSLMLFNVMYKLSSKFNLCRYTCMLYLTWDGYFINEIGWRILNVT